MYIVDSHCDSLALILSGKSRTLVNRYNFSSRYPQLQFAAAFCGIPGETNLQSYVRAQRYMSAFRAALAETDTALVEVCSYSDLQRAVSEKKSAAMLTVEGAGGAIFEKRSLLRELHSAGVRVIGLAWESNELVKSNRLSYGEYDTGLSEIGREVACEINSLGMIFDVSHLSDRSFYDLAQISEKPIIATHSNFRSVCGHSRNLTDDMARLIFSRDGMIGLNLYPPFISEKKERQTAEGLFSQLDYGLMLGGEEHIGFGGDIDGTDGMYPYPLNEASSMHDKVIELMLRHNYSESLVRKIAGENYLAFLEKYL